MRSNCRRQGKAYALLALAYLAAEEGSDLELRLGKLLEHELRPMELAWLLDQCPGTEDLTPQSCAAVIGRMEELKGEKQWLKLN